MRAARFFLPFLLASGLMAQAPRLNGGVMTGLSFPAGDFATKTSSSGDYLGANDGLGLHVGGHLDLNFTSHHQLRLHLTVNGFASQKQDIYTGGLYDGTRQNSFGILQAGGDYVFNATSPTRGGYFLAGLNLNQVKATAEFSNYPDSDLTQSGRLGFRVGGGYTFNRLLSLEAQLNSVSVEKDGSDGLGYDSLAWVSVNVVFRFGR